MREHFTFSSRHDRLTLKLTLDELHLEIQVFENPRMLRSIMGYMDSPLCPTYCATTSVKIMSN